MKLAAEVKDFDASPYYKDKSEQRRTDRFCQFAVAASSEAFEDSGIAGKVANERLGVYIGSGIGGMNTFVAESYKLRDRGPSRVSPFFIPMMIGNIAAGSVAIRFGAEGPSLPVTTACATSTNTIGEAFHAIRFGYADAIIAGGAESTVCPLAVAGFTSCMALTESEDPLRASIPFDRGRSGFVIGEGAGAVILEEYEHAVNRGAKIYAEVTGYGNTCDAHHVTAPHPEGKCAARAIRLAMNEAVITGSEALYINAHGTSTQMNDRTETFAIKSALGEYASKALISSTKSMTGHMLGAAGAVEVIASALALRDGIIPPTMGLDDPDPDCDLDYVPNKAREAAITDALSESFGFGGHDACVALRKFSDKI